jgi:hypothetical protein
VTETASIGPHGGETVWEAERDPRHFRRSETGGSGSKT